MYDYERKTEQLINENKTNIKMHERTDEEAAQVAGAGGVGIVCNRECINPYCSNYLVQVYTNRTTCHICGGAIRPV